MTDPRGAVEFLQSHLQTNPDDAEAAFLLGRVFLDLTEYEEAHKAFARARALTARYDSEIDVRLRLALNQKLKQGLEAMNAGELENAVQAFGAAARIAPDDVEVHLAHAQSLVAAGSYKEAVVSYARALTLDGSNVEALNNVSQLLLELNDCHAAAEYAARQDSLLEVPDANVLRRLSRAHLCAGEYASADAAFQRLRAFPNAAADTRDYAILAFNAGRFSASIPLLRQARVRWDDDGMISRALGEAYRQTGDYLNMLEVFEDLRERFPEDPEILKNLFVANQLVGYRTVADSLRQLVHASINTQAQP